MHYSMGANSKYIETMPKYTVLDKNTIKSETIPYLSVAKRGYSTKSDMVEVVKAHTSQA